MGRIQFITTEGGEELVVLSRRDYDVLLARAGDDEAEDRMTAAVLDEARAKMAAGTEAALPTAVWEAIEAGEAPIRALRKHRKMTQAALAAAAGVSQSVVAEIEGRTRTGSPETLKAFARVLRVPLDILVEG
jgi:DNA-binding XRE family transcriptional regulator